MSRSPTSASRLHLGEGKAGRGCKRDRDFLAGRALAGEPCLPHGSTLTPTPPTHARRWSGPRSRLRATSLSPGRCSGMTPDARRAAGLLRPVRREWRGKGCPESRPGCRRRGCWRSRGRWQRGFGFGSLGRVRSCRVCRARRSRFPRRESRHAVRAPARRRAARDRAGRTRADHGRRCRCSSRTPRSSTRTQVGPDRHGRHRGKPLTVGRERGIYGLVARRVFGNEPGAAHGGLPGGLPLPTDCWRRAMEIPAFQPGARPSCGSAIDSTSSPLRARSQEMVEFEFHISPAASSWRPQTGVGTCWASSSSRRASSDSSLRRREPSPHAGACSITNRPSGSTPAGPSGKGRGDHGARGGRRTIRRPFRSAGCSGPPLPAEASRGRSRPIPQALPQYSVIRHGGRSASPVRATRLGQHPLAQRPLARQ
jgi:hypothetical protein